MEPVRDSRSSLATPAVRRSAGWGVEAKYLRRTPASGGLMARAARAMPGGSTRSGGHFGPYPLVFERGDGPRLWDVDGNRYVDFTYNGLSLIHGHAYAPVERELERVLPQGSAWPGTSQAQMAFGEQLRERIAAVDRVRFTNTGAEATTLAVKLARHITGRPLVIKSWGGASHGSYEEIEAGLWGHGEMPGRTALGRFGDIDSYRAAFDEHEGSVAALIVEPLLFTTEVIPPPPGFLDELVLLARERGALVILDDCLMFRLSEGGSAERFGFEPDLTCLGKFLGGGLPLGALGGPEAFMTALDPSLPDSLYHGGSCSGNPLGCTAGRVTLEHLTAKRIAEMDARAARMGAAMRTKAGALGVPLRVSGEGSVLGCYVVAGDGSVNRALSARLHLAAINRGVYFGRDGELAMATTLDNEALEEAIAGFGAALGDFAEELAETNGEAG
jgi:glutamate-1-semialdehyde 2,1-aminomutase